MKRTIWFAIGWALLMCGVAGAQISNPSGVILVGTAPSGSCSQGSQGQLVTPTGAIWRCQSITAGVGTWAADPSSGGGSGITGLTAGQIPTAGSATTLTSSFATLPASFEPAHTGDMTNTAGALVTTVVGLNGTALSGLATGPLGNTTATGVPFVYSLSGTGQTIPTTTSPTITTPTFAGNATGPGIQNTSGITILPQTANSNTYGTLFCTTAQGGGTSGGFGQFVCQFWGQPDSTFYANPIARLGFKNSSGSKGLMEFGCEGGYDAAGNLIATTEQPTYTHHCYAFDNVNSITWLNYNSSVTLASAVTTTSSNTVAYTGAALLANMVGEKIFGVGCGLPGTTLGTYGVIAMVTPGTGFTYTGTAVTTGATCNVYVLNPYLALPQAVAFQAHVNFTQTTAPTSSAGTISGTDNSFSVTGLSAATSVTVTFNKPIASGRCTANNTAGTGVGVPVPSAWATTATFTMTALTGTLVASCY